MWLARQLKERLQQQQGNQLTLEDEENWDKEPPLPPWEAPPAARLILPSQ